MKLGNEKPSKNVYRQVKGPKQTGSTVRSNRYTPEMQGNGKSDKIFQSPEFKEALRDISKEYQSKVRKSK